MHGLEHLLADKVERHSSRSCFGLLESLVLRSPVPQSLLLLSVSGSELHVAAENRRGQLIPRSGQKQFGAIGTRVRTRPTMELAPHIALGKNAIHRVVLAQEERRLVGLQLLPLPCQSTRSKHHLPGLLRTRAAICIQ